MALFRYTLDGNVLADEPIGWQDLVTELKRDKAVLAQLKVMDSSLSFAGGTDGYAILKPKIDCEGFCSYTEILIEQNCGDGWVTIFEGFIFFTDIKENFMTCVLECKLTEGTYYSFIHNNRNQRAYINVGRSKNDETFTAPTAVAIKFFDPNAAIGVYDNSVYCWYVRDAFSFIISFMSDNTIGFTSDYFGVGGEFEGEMITTGEQVRLRILGGSVKYPFFSFNDLLTELNKKHCLGFAVEEIAGVQTIRVEPRSYFLNSGISTTLSGVNGIVKSVDISQLYAILKFGSDKTIDYVAGATDFPEDITFAGFKEEQFNTTGRCNIDTELDLVSEWVISSNVIQDVYVNGNTDYDEDIFIIETDAPNTLQATKSDTFLLGAPYFYNDALRNVEVSERWFGGVANSIALYLGNGNDEFRAEQTVQQSSNLIETVEPFPFINDYDPPNNDPNSNYQTAALPAITEYAYIAPASGMYAFHVRLFLYIDTFYDLGNPNRFIRKTVNIKRYNAAGVLQQTFSQVNTYSRTVLCPATLSCTVPGRYQIDFSQTLYMAATDYVRVQIVGLATVAASSSCHWDTGGIFECTSAANGGGIFQTYDPQDMKAYLYDFDYPMSFADFQLITTSPLQRITFADENNSVDGWIDNMKYNHTKKLAQFRCINSVQNTDCE